MTQAAMLDAEVRKFGIPRKCENCGDHRMVGICINNRNHNAGKVYSYVRSTVELRSSYH